MYTNQIQTLQIDLVSSCNARCPSCYRQDVLGRPQDNFPKNFHLDLELYEKALRDPGLKDLKEIFLCGNYGDAMASPQILEMIDRTDRVNPHLGFYLHTNGSLGKKSTWSELASRLNGKGRFVKFAIDGLEDTNSIYRRGVSWDLVMDNAKHFIAEGGRAVWKFVVFKHNKHQIELARKLSEQMRFVRFETVQNYTPEREPFVSEEVFLRSPLPAINEPENLPEDRLSAEEREKIKISCDAKKEQSIFMDFEGAIWPCCWIAGWKYSSSPFFRQKHQEYFRLASEGDADFNSLRKHSFSQIIQHPWFAKELEDSWQNTSETPASRLHSFCLSKCGSCR